MKEKIKDVIYERNYVYNFHFHLVWVTKYRKPAFTTPELVEEMKQLLIKSSHSAAVAAAQIVMKM